MERYEEIKEELKALELTPEAYEETLKFVAKLLGI